LGFLRKIMVSGQYLPMFGPVWWFDTSWVEVAGDLQIGQPVCDWVTQQLDSDGSFRLLVETVSDSVFDVLNPIAKDTPAWVNAFGRPLGWSARLGAGICLAEMQMAPGRIVEDRVWKGARAALLLGAVSVVERAKRVGLPLDPKIRKAGPRSDGDLVIFAIHASYRVARGVATADRIAQEAQAARPPGTD